MDQSSGQGQVEVNDYNMDCIGSNERNRRVLSIQSHVVSGYVGNKAAVFPLQLLGFDVDIINSVNFSNHTGYPLGWEGDVLEGDKLIKLVEGMERNGLLVRGSEEENDDGNDGKIGHILTGYIGSESFLRAVVSVVKKLKSMNSNCRYVCDPVLGDLGRFYVPKELVNIYVADVLPLADVITPNQFETEQITGIAIKSIEDAQLACRKLHDLGVSIVLITSIVFSGAHVDESDGNGGNDRLEASDVKKSSLSYPPNSIGMFASRRPRKQLSSTEVETTEKLREEQYILFTPKLPGQFTGTGDVCAALFLGMTADVDECRNEDNPMSDNKSKTGLGDALQKLAGTMNAIVRRTSNKAIKNKTSDANLSSSEKMRIIASREMQLIQSRDDILNPPEPFRAQRL